MADPRFDYQFRVILAGDSMVGKSSLVRYFSEGSFNVMVDPTVGVDFFTRLVSLSNGTSVKLQIWDTAGQEKFKSISRTYYRSSVAAILVFDITKRRTFEHLTDWFEEAHNSMQCTDPTFILLGHKSDLHAQRQVDSLEAEELAKSLDCVAYLETSAILNGLNIERAFTCLAEAVYRKLRQGMFDGLRSRGWDGIKEGYGTHSVSPYVNDRSKDGQDDSHCCT